MVAKTGETDQMTKTKPKEPIWKTDGQEEIDRSIQRLKEDIRINDEGAEHFSKLVKGTQDPNQKAFWSLCQLVQKHYAYSLSFELTVLEWSKDLNMALSQKLQYLDDNMQTIAKKMRIKISNIQKDVAKAQLVNADVHKYLKRSEQDAERIRKMGEAFFDNATRGH
jgi:hypothetical protein